MSDSRYDATDTPGEGERNPRMPTSSRTRSLPDDPRSRNIPHHPPPHDSRPFSTTISGRSTVPVAAPQSAPQSAPASAPGPHRAWETGYQSPFHRPVQQPSHQQHRDDMQFGRHTFDIGADAHIRPPQIASTSRLTAPSVAQGSHPEGQSRRPATYRPRVPKIVTKEIGQDDADVAVLIKLGLSPFMVNQDMIANQNRFVRNEAVLARHIQRLQHDTAAADGRHSRTEQDLYSLLSRLRPTGDIPGGTSSSASPSRSQPARDPDFLALEQAHRETCARLDALSQQVREYSESTERALADLAHRFDQMINTGAYLSDRPSITRSPAATSSASPFLSSASSSSLKRKWESSADSILGSPSTMPPPTPDLRDHPS